MTYSDQVGRSRKIPAAKAHLDAVQLFLSPLRTGLLRSTSKSTVTGPLSLNRTSRFQPCSSLPVEFMNDKKETFSTGIDAVAILPRQQIRDSRIFFDSSGTTKRKCSRQEYRSHCAGKSVGKFTISTSIALNWNTNILTFFSDIFITCLYEFDSIDIRLYQIRIYACL